MKKIIRSSGTLSILSLVVILIIVFTVIMPGMVMASAHLPVDAPPIFPLEILRQIIRIVQGILILIAVLAILFGAFNFITAGGDDKKIETGRKAILYALIAAAIVIMAEGLVAWVVQEFGGGIPTE